MLFLFQNPTLAPGGKDSPALRSGLVPRSDLPDLQCDAQGLHQFYVCINK